MRTLLVVRCTAESLALGPVMVRALQEEMAVAGWGARAVGLLLLGQEYNSAEVSRELEAPVLAQLPWEERTAAFLSQRGRMPRGFSRTALMRSARNAMAPLRQFADRRRLHMQMRASSSTPTGPPERCGCP